MAYKMKNEINTIAQKLLSITNNNDLLKLLPEWRGFYEKLIVLKHQNEVLCKESKVGQDSSFFESIGKAFNNKNSDALEFEDKVFVHLDETEKDEITEPLTEKIKDIVSQMPIENEALDEMLTQNQISGVLFDKDWENMANNYKNTPVFEAVNDVANDEKVLIETLFNGNAQEFIKLKTQLTQLKSLQHAKEFIDQSVKPNSKNWQNKENYDRFFLLLKNHLPN